MFPPQSIVSLLPSSTEICFALGLGDRVVGVSHECDFPPEVSGRPVLTRPKVDPHATSVEIDQQVRALVADGLSVYRIDEARLRELRPDLIITQDVCEVCAVSFADVREATARLLGAEASILSLSPLTLADVLDDIVRVGRAAGVEDRAQKLVAELRARLDGLRTETAALPRRRTLVLEWLSPPMIAGHWTPELVRIAGGEPMAKRKRRAFSVEFKAEAVRLCQVGDRSIAKVAQDLDLTETALREWVRAAEANVGERPPRGPHGRRARGAVAAEA